MRQITLRQGIAIFLVLFIVPVLLLVPFRTDLMATFPDPTLWQAVNNLLGSIFVFGLAIYAYNQRQRIKELEREVERERYRREQALTDGGTHSLKNCATESTNTASDTNHTNKTRNTE